MQTLNGKARPKFLLGQLVATPGALRMLEEAGQSPAFFIEKHQAGDWGEVDAEDQRANDEALANEGRLLSAYKTLKGDRILDNHRGRSVFNLSAST